MHAEVNVYIEMLRYDLIYIDEQEKFNEHKPCRNVLEYDINIAHFRQKQPCVCDDTKFNGRLVIVFQIIVFKAHALEQYAEG